jgi:hypothetical protein
MNAHSLGVDLDCLPGTAATDHLQPARDELLGVGRSFAEQHLSDVGRIAIVLPRDPARLRTSCEQREPLTIFAMFC